MKMSLKSLFIKSLSTMKKKKMAKPVTVSVVYFNPTSSVTQS